MLKDALVLLAEDQVFIALDLAMAIEDAGGRVAGPVASVKNALALIKSQPITAAILDYNLTDGDILPVAASLIEAGIPVIIQSGVGLPSTTKAQFPDLVVFMKPYNTAELIAKLGSLLMLKEATLNV